MKRHTPILNHLLFLTLIFFISGCTDTVTNDKQEVIIELFNKQITQNDIKAKPPTPDELTNYIFTPFHVELLNLIHETTLKNAISYWKISPSDEEILKNEQEYFNSFPLDREYTEEFITMNEPVVEAYKLYLAGSSPEDIYEKFKEKTPYQLGNWQRMLSNRKDIEKFLPINEENVLFYKELLKKSDTEIEKHYKQILLKSSRKGYRHMLIGKAICDDDEVPLKNSSVPITLGEKCIEYASVWLSDYFHNNMKNPSSATSESILALDFSSSLGTHENIRNSMIKAKKKLRENEQNLMKN